jgi:hypothetical protein
MNSPTIQLNEQQIMGALAQYQPKDLKRIISRLVRTNRYIPSTLDEVTRSASVCVQQNNTPESIVMEAVQWARGKK